MTDYGIKISKAGEDVTSTADSNLLISSKFPMFKVKSQGDSTVTMAQTTLSANIDSSQTTIPLTSLSNVPLGSLTETKFIMVYNATYYDWEAISYPGTISGNSLTGCTRGYFGTTPRASTSGRDVVIGYNENSISHGLSYPPVHLVWDDSYNSVLPVPLDEWASLAGAKVDSSNLYISVDLRGHIISSYPLPPTSYDYKYIIMYDSITTPYY